MFFNLMRGLSVFYSTGGGYAEGAGVTISVHFGPPGLPLGPLVSRGPPGNQGTQIYKRIHGLFWSQEERGAARMGAKELGGARSSQEE